MVVKLYYFLSEKWVWYNPSWLVSGLKRGCVCWASIDLGGIDWEGVRGGRRWERRYVCRETDSAINLKRFPQFLPLRVYLKHHPLQCKDIFKI